MSHFTRPVTIQQKPGSDTLWEVRTKGLAWEVGNIGSGDLVPIPAGTITDLASVPRILWALIPPFGRHTNASILHDALYAKGDKRGRRWADQQFLEAMIALDVPDVRARVMWAAVRLAGWRHWP